MIRRFFAIIQIGFGLFVFLFSSYIEKLIGLELGIWFITAILITIDGLVTLFTKK